MKKGSMLPAGIADFTNNNDDVILYPNPASDKFQIKSEKLKVKSIEIFTLQGQVVMNALSQNKNTVELDVSSLSKGIYLVKIQCEKNIVNKKIVVQ